MIGAFIASTFCACSNDEDEVLSGETEVAQIMDAVDGQIDNMYVYDNEEDTYYIEASNIDGAKALAKELTAGKWDGKSSSVKLSDNYGTVSVSSTTVSEAVYYTMGFSFRKTSFSDACDVKINLVNEAYFSSDNADTKPVKPRRKSVFPKDGKSEEGSSSSSNNNSDNGDDSASNN
jgi:hypothetical protein